MKKLFLPLFLISFMLSGLAGAAAPDVATGSMVSYWPLNGNANDAVGSNHGSGYVSSYPPGISSYSAKFDGVDDYIDVGPSYNFNSVGGGFTLSAWVKPLDQTPNAPYSDSGRIVGTYSSNYPDNCASGYGLTAYDGGVMSFIINQGDCGTNQLTLQAHTAVGEWVHIVGTYNINGNYKMYKGGVLVNQFSGFGWGIDDESTPLMIGASKSMYGDQGYMESHFNGRIDEVVYWNRALSGSEVEGVRAFYGERNCGDEIDNDFDGFIDACDADCNDDGDIIADSNGAPYSPYWYTEICDDLDNDCNGEVDEGDVCASTGIPYWTDMNGNIIDESADKGDTVRMNVPGVNLEGEAANFSIYNSTGTFQWWNPLTWFMQDDQSYVGKATIQLDTAGVYYFIAEIPSLGITSAQSTDLTVSSSTDDDPLILEIQNPTCGSNFTIGTEVEIIVNISDNDDEVTGTLTLNDTTILALTNGVNSIDYTFDSDGEYSLIASVNNSRGKDAKDISNIIITDSSSDKQYVAACIDHPENYASFSNSTVDFLATSTSAIDCTSGTCELINYDSGDLLYTWTFPDDAEVGNLTIYGNSTDLNGNETLDPYNFTANFIASGDHTATLDVSFI